MTMDQELIKEVALFLGVLGLSAVVLLIIRSLLLRALRRVAKKTSTMADDVLLSTLKHPSIWWAIAIALYIAIDTSEFPEKYVNIGLKAIYVIVVLSVTMALAGFLSRLMQAAVERRGVPVPTTGLSKTIINASVFAIGFMIILNGLGVSITPLLTALGVGGLAVALALQDTLSNLFAGVLITVEKPLSVGDYVKLDSGEEGYVEDIGWRSTRIKKLQNNIIIIPNSKLSKSVITNYYMPEKRMSLLIPIGVSYKSDPEQVERILTEETLAAAEEVDGLLSDPKPFVRFIPGFGDHSLDFTLICQVAEFVDQYLVQHELRKRIFNRLKRENIEIPFPIRTVYLKQDA